MIALGYVLQAWFYAAYYWSLGLTFPWWAIVGMGALASAVLGVVWLLWTGWALRTTGKWLAGVGSREAIRAVCIRAKAGMLWMLPLWGVFIFLNPQTVFILDAGVPSSVLVNGTIFILGTCAQVKRIQMVREVQGFSWPRAAANISIVWLLSSVLFFFVFCIVRLIYLSV